MFQAYRVSEWLSRREPKHLAYDRWEQRNSNGNMDDRIDYNRCSQANRTGHNLEVQSRAKGH